MPRAGCASTSSPPGCLSGGLPLLGRSHGWAADRVRAMDVVTADGRLRHVTPDGEPDLYGAARRT
ncbi:hypothetical protein ACIBKY_53665 [Nonomuraea sp. NPDC050394]|uniref:hypothetical protein n=1 Tax=Nonomuraea sp. NPDC050394 TaxID=3364363 RepID=UPI0037A9FEE2